MFKHISRSCVALSLALLAASGSSTAQTAPWGYSDSFENPGFTVTGPSDNFRYLAHGDTTTLTGWRAADDGIGEMPYVFHRTRYGVHDGDYAVALNQGSSISAQVILNVDVLYELSAWMYAGNGPLNLPPDPLAVSVGDATTTWTDTFMDGEYHRYTFRFLATDGDAIPLRFANVSSVGDYKGYALDAVTLAAVPEPAPLALFAGGLALAFLRSAWRRRRVPLVGAACLMGLTGLLGSAPALAYSEFGYYTGAFVVAPHQPGLDCVSQGVSPSGPPPCMDYTDYPRAQSSVFLSGRTAGNYGSASVDLASASLQSDAVFPERGDDNGARSFANLYDTFTVSGAMPVPVMVTVTMTIDSWTSGPAHLNPNDLVFAAVDAASELVGNQTAYFHRTQLDPYGDLRSVITTSVLIDDQRPVFRLSGSLFTSDPNFHSATARAFIDIALPAGLSWTSASGVFGSAVPEPSTWAMWAAGLLALGRAARRRT